MSSAAPQAAEWIHKVLIYASSTGCTFRCCYKNRKHNPTFSFPSFPLYFLSPLFVSFLFVTRSNSDHCLHTWRRQELRQTKVDRWVFGSNLLTEAVSVVIRDNLHLFIYTVWLWLNVCLCVIALTLSNGGPLLTKLLSKHKTNWSRNQPADLRAVKEKIKFNQ